MSIFGDRVTVPSDASSASWLLSRLGGSGTVGGLVPSGFERYAVVRRVPSDDVDDEGAELASELAVLVGPYTSTPDLVWYAIWEGYGWETATTLYAAPSGPLSWVSRVRVRRHRRRAVRDRAQLVRAGLGQVPSFDVPLRRYFLVEGALESVSVIARPGGSGFQVPDLWWPQDRSWFVASDTDLDWSYVGGSEASVARVLEAFPGRSQAVEWTDPITPLPEGLSSPRRPRRS